MGCLCRLLDEDVERGVVERDDVGGYRLTPDAQQRYGPALRLLASLGAERS